MARQLEDYAYLWNRTDQGWVLIKAPELVGGYCIYNELNKVLLHVDDGDLSLLLCQRMREAGCKILDDLPKNIGPATVEPFKEDL